MNKTFELRWLETATEKVLQYRIKETVVDYSATNLRSGDYLQNQVWSPWFDVPTHKQGV